MLLIGLKRLDFLGELFVLLIGVLKKLILLLEALFEFRSQCGVFLGRVGDGGITGDGGKDGLIGGFGWDAATGDGAGGTGRRTCCCSA